MHNRHFSGRRKLLVLMSSLLCVVIAPVSRSYATVDEDASDYTDAAEGTSQHFIIQAGTTWKEEGLASATFQIAPEAPIPVTQNVVQQVPSVSNPSSTPRIGGSGNKKVSKPVGTAQKRAQLSTPKPGVGSQPLKPASPRPLRPAPGQAPTGAKPALPGGKPVSTPQKNAPAALTKHRRNQAIKANGRREVRRTQRLAQRSGSDISQSRAGSRNLSWRGSLLGQARSMIDRTVLWQMILILLGCVLIVAGKSCRKSKRDRKILITLGIVCIILGVAVISLQVTTEQAHAATTVPAKRMYKGHLLDAAGKPLTAPHVIRFSYWKSADAVPSDFNAGAINTNAPNFVSWQESHVVTPGANGYFAVQLGSTNPLPDYTTMPTETLLSLYLQVEVKKSGDPDSMFEDLDVDPTDAGRDRSPILSVPFARNADLLDQRDVGTGSGDIVYLMSGGLLDIGAIPGGTERDAFAVDADGSSQTPTLSFGQNLAKTLKYDMVDSRFVFNDDLRILGDLTVTGLINGVNIEGLVGGGADSVSSGSLVFQPGYPSAAYEADGSGNVGRLFVDHDAGSKQNHYSWTSTMASLQDYDVRLRVTLPRTFAGWDTLLPMRVDYRSSSLLPINSKLDIAVYDTAGNAVTLVGTSQSLAATSWSTASLSFAPGSTWTAGSDFLVIFKLSAKSNERVDLGALKLYLKE